MKRNLVALDTELARRNLEATGRTAAGWARAHGFDPERVRNILRGRFMATKEEADAFKKDGLLKRSA